MFIWKEKSSFDELKKNGSEINTHTAAKRSLYQPVQRLEALFFTRPQ
jgi:hypothetical protein